MSWTHRRTWPDHRANDRAICRDGKVVGRTYQYEHGPQAGLWGWFGTWVGTDNQGVAATLDEALETVRRIYLERLAQGKER